MRFARFRRRRIWIALATIASAIAWCAVRESPDEMVARLGGKVLRQYHGPGWAVDLLKGGGLKTEIAVALSVSTRVDAEGTAFTDEHIRRLVSLKSLESIILNNTQITDAALIHIAKLRNLKQLSLGGTRITDQGLQALAGMPALESLNLSGARITDRGIASLSALPRLKTLHLARTDITGAALSQLAEMARLEALDLSGTQIRDDDLPSLRRSLIITLWLNDTPITDAGIAHLRHAPRICGMYLPHTLITEEAFDEFEKFPTLGWVSVSVTEVGVTDDEIKSFQSRQSRVRVAVQPDQ